MKEKNKDNKKTLNYTYIVKCADDTYYTGWTTDIEQRLKKHNAGIGAKYTRNRAPVELVYLEVSETKQIAMQREYAIKQLTRKEKEVLIRSGGEGEERISLGKKNGLEEISMKSGKKMSPENIKGPETKFKEEKVNKQSKRELSKTESSTTNVNRKALNKKKIEKPEVQENQYETVTHEFGPVYDAHSRILILGSFPSVKSREQNFYYGHPQNRFWKLLAALLREEVPQGIEEKRSFLLRNGIAVWDVIEQCDIVGSSDSSIRNVIPNQLSIILDKADIQEIYCNGGKAYELYHRFQEKETGRTAVKLPSTSPANAVFSMERLLNEWKRIMMIKNE